MPQMDRQQIWGVNVFRDFTGGENRRIISELLAPNQVVLARNCIITPEGALESRKGKTLITGSAFSGAVRAAWRWSGSNGDKYLTCVVANKVYHVEWDGVSTIATFGTEVKTLSSSTNKIRGKVWKDVLILGDGVSNSFKVEGDGTCTDLGGTPPKFNIFTVHAGKIAAIDYNNPSQLRFSGLEDYDTWNALDVYNILSNDGTECTGLDSQENGLAIYKEDSTWALYGFDRFDFQMTTGPIATVGAVNQDAVLPKLFLGKDNFYASNLPGVVPMPNTHGYTIERYTPAERAATIACYDMDSRFAVVAIGLDIYCLNGDANGTVTSWDALSPTCLAYSQDTGDVVVGCADGNIYILTNEVDDDGQLFFTDIRTSYQDMSSVRQKVFRNINHRFEVLSGGRDVLVNAVTDFGKTNQVKTAPLITLDPLEWDIDDWDLADWASDYDARGEYTHWLHNLRGKYLSVGFRTAARVKFLGYSVKFREAGYLI